MPTFPQTLIALKQEARAICKGVLPDEVDFRDLSLELQRGNLFVTLHSDECLSQMEEGDNIVRVSTQMMMRASTSLSNGELFSISSSSPASKVSAVTVTSQGFLIPLQRSLTPGLSGSPITEGPSFKKARFNYTDINGTFR